MIEIIKAAFSAGEVKTFLIQGEYLEILEAAYPIDVAMMDRSGAQLSTMRNAEASYFSRPGKYEVIQVTSEKAQTVRLFVGSGDAGTRRTSGDVSVIDGGKSRTFANVAFSAVPSCGPVTGQQARCQLWNPAGSGKRLVISQIFVGSSFQNTLYLLGSNVALTALTGTLAVSKLIGGASGVAELRRDNTINTPVGNYSGVLAVAGTSVSGYKLTEPLVLNPGFGLMLWTTVVASDIYGTFEYIEESI